MYFCTVQKSTKMHVYLERLIPFSLLLIISLFACEQNSLPEIVEEAPSGFILSDADLPEYESNIDHASFMQNWSKEFFHKGMITYRSVCFNCHGNVEQPGSIPTSTKFWADEFKYGDDPYSIYQTMTKGYGLMAPQVRLTPQEKYEVIHFIREEYIKEYNPDRYFEVDQAYMDSLPKGDSKGPEPKEYQPWAEMDYGDFYIHSYELADSLHPPREISGGPSPLPNEDYRTYNFAYKGIAIRLDEGDGGVAAGNAFALFDHDLLRFTGFWTGKGFVDWRDILMNDEHNVYPRTVGRIHVENQITPGWANPATGGYEDPRFVAVDGRPFGPLPREWAHYKGLYIHGRNVVIKYTVDEAVVHEMYRLERVDPPIVSRTLNISPAQTPLYMRVAPLSAALSFALNFGTVRAEDGYYVLEVPPAQSSSQDEQIRVKILMASDGQEALDKMALNSTPEDLSKYTNGGPARFADQVLTTPILTGETDEAYEVDVFQLPQVNPWRSRMRLSGIEFIKDGEEALICTIDGEVYRLEGILQKKGNIKWHRIATGLFQPLGIKYHKGDIYVGCRDQIAILRDLNGDGEMDFYESFNSDHQVTEHFHEFAMGLQVDSEDNFYYAKSARHARKSLIPRHGTLIKVSPDGLKSEILAKGFRAANGICLNPDGSFYVTDQEGHWNPMNRINRVTEGGFYGNMFGYNPPVDSSNAAMIQPMFWVDSKYDRSPSELVWVDGDRWGPLNGALLNMSYGYGKIYVVMPETIGNGEEQGGMVELPVPRFPTGLMRARFNPKDGQFYGCGMSAWATSQMIQVGGLYRVRYTGKQLNLPLELSARENGMQLTFSDPLNALVATDTANWTVNTWDLKRTRRYGSDRYNTKTLTIEKVTLGSDGKKILLEIPEIKTTWVMEILYDLESKKGKKFNGAVQSSIYELGDELLL